MAISLLVALLAFATCARAQQEPATSDAPAALPAEALAFAAKLEEQAPPKLLDWARKHARDLLRDEFRADELSAESIAKLFPAQPAPAQEAVRFLVGYEAYRRATQQQETQAASLRDVDRDLKDLEDRLRLLKATGAPIGTVAAQERDAAIANTQFRIEQLQNRRSLVVRVEERERQRVDACLRWLAEAHPRVKDIPADTLRSVPPPRS